MSLLDRIRALFQRPDYLGMSPEARVAPERFTIEPDDHHAELVGTASDGRRFFITTPFERGIEYVTTFFWAPDGSYDSIVIEDLGPRAELDGAAIGEVLKRHTASLGGHVIESISVAPFAVESHGTIFGFVAREPDADDPDGAAAVELLPGNFMAYFWPWDSGYYDT